MNFPRGISILFADFWDIFAKLSRGKLPFLKRTIITYSTDDIAKAEKINNELGFVTRIPIEEGLKRMAKSYQTK
jgi:nucleoside-diphosphate-sugar epimerase